MYEEYFLSEDHSFDKTKTRIEKFYKGFADEKKAKSFCTYNSTAKAELVDNDGYHFDPKYKYVVTFYRKCTYMYRENKIIGYYTEDVTINDMKNYFEGGNKNEVRL